MSTVVTAILSVYTVLLGFMLKDQFFTKRRSSRRGRYSRASYEAKPYVLITRDGVDVSFQNPDVQNLSYRVRRRRVEKCLPYLREYEETVKDENLGLMEEMPSYIPVFKEKSNMVDMSFTIKEYYQRIANDWDEYNPIRKLGYYNQKVPEERYDDIPGQGSDFAMPNMGLFNDKNYCNVHDSLLLAHPEISQDKLYFLSDYHPLSIPRWFGLGEFGKDTAPRLSKNMKLVNWYQRNHAVDPRVSLIYTKKAAFHAYHEIGNHMGCWGQSYNHIPGHGSMIRKDSLVTSANDYLAKHRRAGKLQCFNETTYFPLSFRLYVEDECRQYFDLIQSAGYAQDKLKSEVQYILKVGFGVHRGAGVYLIDNLVEGNLLGNYSKGLKCGQIDENLVAQKYIYDPLTIDGGHKFDFRLYMLVASVDPLVVYYHDGFLRVSLFKYSKSDIDDRAHLTNTELAKKIFHEVENGGTHMGMDINQLRDFQMRLLPQFEQYLLSKGIVKDRDWLENKLRRDFYKAYIHLVKMVEHKLEKNPGLFEVFGVDFVIDENFQIYVVEVNASPMQVGTSTEKTKLMKKMNKGIVKITLAFLRSRVKRSLAFLKEHADEIKNGENLEALGKEFRELNRNKVEPEYEHYLEDLSWKKIVDESLEGPAAYSNLIEEECIDIMNAKE